MSESVSEEISVLSSIYCGEGEFELLQESGEGVTVQICSSGVTVLFNLPPSYPMSPPGISVSSSALSRLQCQDIRHKLLQHAATLPPEAMLHQLMEKLQNLEVSDSCSRAESQLSKDQVQDQDQWVSVLSLDHIRSRKRYVSLLEQWCKQLQLRGRLLLGRHILVLLQGNRANIKEFCRLLKTVKVDVDSSGKKCKEKMMKVLTETPSSFSTQNSLQGFEVLEYQTLTELRAVFEETGLFEIYKTIQPSLPE